MSKKSLVVTATELYELLEPLEAGERQRVVNAAFALLGENLHSGGTAPKEREQQGDLFVGPILFDSQV